MKAQLRFLFRPSFNVPPNGVLLPGVLVGRAADRRLWTLSFTATQQLDAVEYLGDLRWLADPVEQDFGPRVKFVIVSNPKVYIDGSTMGVLAQGELLG